MRTDHSVIFSALPPPVGVELRNIGASRVGGISSFSEIHLTLGRRSSVLSCGERIYLTTPVNESEMQKTVHKLCDGAIYAHRDSITDGYISLDGGIRVGVCGQARYESEKLVGISDISSLVFRIPTAESSLTEELYASWLDAGRGMLIYSAPGVGKTTALRSLVKRIAESNAAERIAVVDERCEFSVAESRRLGIILLRGYRRADGMEIALRTMSPTVIAVDEIGTGNESRDMADSLNSGVRILATAHANSLADLRKRGGFKALDEAEVFDVFFGIFHTDTGYSYKMEKI